MKKILLFVAVVALVSIIAVTSLVGCSSVSQTSKLQACWLDYESYTYEVTVPDTEALKTDENAPRLTVGSLVITTKRFRASTPVNLAGDSYNLQGTLFSYKLEITENSVTNVVIKQVICDSSLSPIASYVEKKTDGNTTNTHYVKYGSKKVEVIVDGNKTGEFKRPSSAFYDNDMLYYVLRASGVYEDNYSISFTVTDNDSLTGATYTVAGSLANNNVTGFKFGGDKDIENCRRFKLTASNKLGSYSTLVSFAKTLYITKPGDTKPTTILKPIIQIIEGDYCYNLTDINLIEE